MTYYWRLTPSTPADAREGARPRTEGASGVQRDAAQATFATQGDAETYLGENWRAWAAAGVIGVTLMKDAASMYDMSLQS